MGHPLFISTGFTQQSGVFSISKPDELLTQKFIDAMPGKYRLIDINLNSENIIATPHFYIKIICLTSTMTMIFSEKIIAVQQQEMLTKQLIQALL